MKIGLIAMSGLRLCKPELLELGLSFPAVARRAKEIEALPSLGLLTIAGQTPKNVSVEYIEVRDVDHDDLPLHLDAVALSTLTATAKEAYRLAARFREFGMPVILGGLHATLNPADAEPHVDAVVVGEGEPVWPNIVRDLQNNRLQSRYDARAEGPFDFAEAPMPRFDLLQPDRYPRFTVQTQRGCPLACEFCAASMRLSPFKVKPVHKVIAEVRRLKELYNNPFIEFADDNTFVNRRHSKNLLRALEHEQIRWFTETDLSIADDEELLRMIRAAGCAQVLIGFEQPAYEALDGVELNSNWKANRADRYLRAVEKIQRHGITVNGCFIFGLDGTGPESFRDVFRFVRESGLYDVQITYLTPFPGTPLYQRLSEEGRILAEDASERCTLFDINFQPDQMSVSELEENFIKLAGRLYHPRFVAERSRRFKSHLRNRIKEERQAKRPAA
ncbi:MAG: radical SAM protein [Verrucomicrobiota bacterium]